ncbi:MAG TPA: DUF4255 domain-containing protein, partial [Cryptosporangiaceae bacterium]|nr:DUF4255 domain-containing protein [Cryptosporangiaceae bacterium]
MIHEVDEALRQLVRAEALGGGVEVVFDAPTKEWSARRNAPTVNLYLYDIREDVRKRQRGLIDERDEEGMVTARQPPPRHFKLSYLITAWTQRPEDEHRLLSSLLACFLRHEAVPTEMLGRTLTQLGLPVQVTVALPPPEDRSFADVWSALGGELKPSLDLVVSAPVDTGQRQVAGPPVREGLRIEPSSLDGEQDDGRVGWDNAGQAAGAPPVQAAHPPRHAPDQRDSGESPADGAPPVGGRRA